MKHGPVRARSGFTIVEVVVAMVVMVLAVMIATNLLTESNKNSLKAERRARLSVALAEFEKLSNRLVSAVSPSAFDPQWTFRVDSSGAATTVVGDDWYSTDAGNKILSPRAVPSPLPSPAPQVVPNIVFGSYMRARTTHDLDIYHLENSGVVVDALYMSRCVPVGELPNVHGKYQTIADVDALDRPLMISPTEFRCCKLSGTVLAPIVGTCVDREKQVPTIFVYRGENKVSALPADSDRDVLPGLGFVMIFRFPSVASDTPSDASLVTLWVQNSCMIGRLSAQWPCRAAPGTTLSDADFRAQTEAKFTSQPAKLVSSMGGSGFMRLDTGVIRDP